MKFNAKRFTRFMSLEGGEGDAGGSAGGSGGIIPGQPIIMPDFKAFIGTLDESLRNEPSVQQIPDYPTLVKSYVNAEKLIGAKRIAIPGENATQVERDAFLTAIGRPETPDKYTAKFKEGFQYASEDDLKWVHTAAHKNGIPDTSLKGFLEDYSDHIAGQAANLETVRKQEKETTLANLRKEYGAAYDKHLEAGDRFLQNFADPELINIFKQTGLVHNEKFVKFCASSGIKLLEDGVIGGGGGGGFVMTPDQAKGKITELLSDKDFSSQYTNKQDPAHQAAVERMSQLFAMAHPQEDTGN